MNKLAITLPGGQTINNPTPQFTDAASLISGLFNIAIFITTFIAFYWFVWGAWQYIFAAGEKEALGKARERIKWALIGFLFIAASYAMATYVGEVFPPGKGGLPF